MDDKYTFVVYGPEADSVQALYVNGTLNRSGDNYHEGIARVLQGWWECLRHIGYKETDLNVFHVPVAKCRDLLEGDSVPEKWPNQYNEFAKLKERL